MKAGDLIRLKNPESLEEVLNRSFSELKNLRVVELGRQGMLLKSEQFSENPMLFMVLLTKPNIYITYDTNDIGPENICLSQMVYIIDNPDHFDVVDHKLGVNCWKILPRLALFMILTENLSNSMFYKPSGGYKISNLERREERFIYNLLRPLIDKKVYSNKAFRRLIYFMSTRNLLADRLSNIKADFSSWRLANDTTAPTTYYSLSQTTTT